MTKSFGKKPIGDKSQHPVVKPVAGPQPGPPTKPDYWDPKGVPGQNTKKPKKP